MIGYYIHHVGAGHVHRAEAIARHLRRPVAGLSSLPRPPSWNGDWIRLPRDDAAEQVADPTSGGRLHWAPRRDRGLRGRMAALAGWIERADPLVLVSDLSAEVTVLARLLGVPVVMTTLPGQRTDPAHQLAYDLADAILAPWPRLAPTMCRGLDRHAGKVHHVGGLSRFDGRPMRPPAARGAVKHAISLRGGGGGVAAPYAAADARGWQWRACGPGRWLDDPWPEICAADVVVTHCGLGALSDVAAARRPAVLVPEPRPHAEQVATARALASAGVGLVLDREPAPSEWPALLDEAARRGGTSWSVWSNGDAAERAAAVIAEVAGSR